MQMLGFTLEGKKSSDQRFKGFILMEITGHFSHINLSIKKKQYLHCIIKQPPVKSSSFFC